MTRRSSAPPDWEFRHRALLFGLIFGLTFPLYALDRHNAGVAIANWIGFALRMNTHLVSRFLFFIGAALLATAAFLRTWASSYLRAQVVYAPGLRTESLVADGPYRRVRNPLYLGSVLMAAGLGVMMNRIGFPVAMLATVVFWACNAPSVRGSVRYFPWIGVPRSVVLASVRGCNP